MSIGRKNRFFDHDQIFFDGKESIDSRPNNRTYAEKARTKLLLMLAFLSYGGCAGYSSRKECDFWEKKINVDANDKNNLDMDELAYNFKIKNDEYMSPETNNSKKENFGGIELSLNGEYNVPGISKSAKTMRHKDFPEVQFLDCRLTKGLGSVVYSNALVAIEGKSEKRESHKETYYSQKVKKGGALKIPGRHIAKDGTVRDGDGYIVLAAPLKIYPRGTRIMTTLGPGKVYDTGGMKGRWIDIYVNW